MDEGSPPLPQGPGPIGKHSRSGRITNARRRLTTNETAARVILSPDTVVPTYDNCPVSPLPGCICGHEMSQMNWYTQKVA